MRNRLACIFRTRVSAPPCTSQLLVSPSFFTSPTPPPPTLQQPLSLCQLVLENSSAPYLHCSTPVFHAPSTYSLFFFIMYSHQGGRPGAPTMTNRYMKGRLPEGVDFAAYPGRSSTPLPTAESKSAERINQLKIWNEAATNDDKRRLNASKAKGVNVATTASTRRTDSYKDAKDRHSASFHGAPPPPLESKLDHSQRTSIRTGGVPLAANKDMFADRSDSESDEDSLGPDIQDERVEDPVPMPPNPPQNKTQHSSPSPPTAPANISAVAPAMPHPIPTPRRNDPSTVAPESSIPQPKESKACCTIM